MKSVRRILWVLVGIVAFGVTGWAASETGPRTVSGFANETIDEHMLIDQYDGPATCVACHEEEAREMFGSVHYQWSGSTPNVPDISGPAGKGDRGFNTYCGTVVSSRRISCWGCHVGNGKAPSTQATAEQLNNIDCMMCHQPLYERKARGPFETLTYTGFDGVSRSWELPVEDAEGNFQFEPDLVKMGIDILTAARTVGKPTRAACLRCHAYAAGSDCGKRGDLSEASADAPADADVHLAPLGADLTCQSCHRSEDHRVLGRGLDLRPNDRPERLTCMTIGCHEDPPHDSSRINRHTARVACQSCHIPEYATLATTEMARVWETPVYYSGLLGGQGGFKPEEIREGNVLPTYRWYNGTSRVYALGQVAQAGTTGAYELGLPYGGVDSLTAQIHPMKEHVSTSGLHDATGQLIPQSTFTYFVTGDFDRAVQDGMTFAGLSGEWQTVDVHTYQTINHGVEPSENALGCGACHTDFSDGDPVCMDLKGDLGYQLKGPTAQICIQCHEFESPREFEKTHHKHVTDKRLDCSWCHGFTRPERGLDTQVTPDIRANGEDGPITVSRDTAVSITVALDPGRLSGTMMDWWVAADTPTPPPEGWDEWYAYVYPSGWQPGVHLTVQTPLFSLGAFEILNMALPEGDYVFYFALDENADGQPSYTWFDTVTVHVQ